MRLAGSFFLSGIVHHLTEAGTMFKRMLMLGPAALFAAACGIDRPHPTDATASTATVSFSAVKFWEVGATVSWNKLATDLAAAAPAPGINAIRLYTYLSLAQLRAAEAAQAAPGPHPPIAAAIGGASVAVLSSFFPSSVAQLEDALDAQAASDPWPGAKHADFAAGEAIGRAVGARVLTFAQGDHVGATDPLLPPIGPPPVGPGHWIYAPPPVIARGNLGARPFFLTSQDQLRSAPPPAFGSDAFNTALAEVRHISDTRTQEQIDIANFWNVNQSPRSQAAFMGIARELIVSHHRSDAEAARLMFVMSAAGFDALIGCFDAKYHYWFIRPPQADVGIHTVFPTPQHPSYPSAHSCFSGAFSGVLIDAFPSERALLEGMAQEASLSRLYAGIHYRFDFEAGLELGRRAAALAVAADLDQVAPGTR
jgi:membrane-associated phospholipid phosphatase